MSLSKEQLNSVIDFSAEDRAQARADDGTGQQRIPIGDVRLKITALDYHTKEGDKGHTMLKVGYTVTEALGGTSKDAIGMFSEWNLYGMAKSPKKMKDKMEGLLRAVGTKPGPIKLGDLMGREIDATVVWERSEGTPDEMTGEARTFVNDRISAIRPKGAPRKAGFNPVVVSRAALSYLKDAGIPYDLPAGAKDAENVGGEGDGDEAAAGGSGNGASAASDVAEDLPPWGDETPVSSFVPESEVPKNAHAFRAVAQMGGGGSDSARQQLLDKNIDPDGPVVVDHLNGKMRDRFRDFKQQQVARKPASRA